MGNSLQDQLKRSGLVDEKKIRKVRQDRRAKRKRGESDTEAEAVREQARAAAAENAERDRALNRERQAEAEARAVAAQVRQLVERNRVARREGDVAYNFTDGTVVRRVHLDTGAHAEVVAGALAIVRLGDGYEVVPAPVARKIAERQPGDVLVLNEASGAAESEDYAGYEIPDDLMW